LTNTVLEEILISVGLLRNDSEQTSVLRNMSSLRTINWGYAEHFWKNYDTAEGGGNNDKAAKGQSA
jgi:hypothetical protein